MYWRRLNQFYIRCVHLDVFFLQADVVKGNVSEGTLQLLILMDTLDLYIRVYIDM